MLFVLSPAKSLDYETPSKVTQPTTPQFVARSAELIDILKAKSPAEIAALMDLSDPLAAQAQADAGRLWVKAHRDYDVLARGVEARLRALVPSSARSCQTGIGEPILAPPRSRRSTPPTERPGSGRA